MSFPSYELLDSGDEEKLERFGEYVLARPDPQALWEKRLPLSEWRKADAWFERKGKEGKWHVKESLPKEWPITYGDITLSIRPTSFKHVGLFPEQISNWEWMKQIVTKSNRQNINVLNLFAYTGGATLSLARVGASVAHVDASKVANQWARENAKLSGLEGAPIRWLTEDVLTFMKREARRGVKYDGILMDPPAFGHGPKKELWKIERDFLALMKHATALLSEKPLFVLVSGYAAGYSSRMIENNMFTLKDTHGGIIERGELELSETKSGRVLPCGIYGRWTSIV